MAGQNGGPWGGGGNNGSGGRNDDRPSDPRRPGDNPQMPEIDQLINRGREQLRVLMGGGGKRRPPMGGGSRGGGGGPRLTRATISIAALAAVVLWGLASFYTVRPEERAVELFLGKFSSIGEPGLNFAPWPFVTAEVLPVTREQTIEIGTSRSGTEQGLMLTGDENIVDIGFQVVWNIRNPAEYLFNLSDPPTVIAATAESVMREIIAQSELAPILNRDRGIIAQSLAESLQRTLDSYNSGVNIVRVNLDRADPPEEVIGAFREVQDASQERDRLQNIADAYSNRVLAEARGEAAQVLEQAEAYRARAINEAEGEASRFSAVLAEYANAPEVTRKRLYLETMEDVLGGVDIILLDENGGNGQGVVPYLPLNELRRTTTTATPSTSTTTTPAPVGATVGGSN